MNKYLIGIKQKDRNILGEIYRENFPQIKTFILQNSGSDKDAEDVFQEALTSIFRRLQKGDFTINVEFVTYLYSAAKYIWFRKNKEQRNISLDEISELQDSQDIEFELTKESRRKLFKESLTKLSEDCQKILELFFSKISFRIIGEQMGYSEEYARHKKRNCQNKLIESVKSSPYFEGLEE